ncbi:U-box domain-containing protein 35 isoform X2 [Spinacia oleracea]|nr:U-box domain-containing protein 35 isoform X2 [Spinacia oleracea]
MGAASRGAISRFTKSDIPAAISKGVPEFCTVYIISKTGKISITRSASRPPPIVSQLRTQIMKQPTSAPVTPPRVSSEKTTPSGSPFKGIEDMDFKSAFSRGGRHPHFRSYGDILTDNDISFVSNGRPSVDCILPLPYDYTEERRSTSNNRPSTSSENDYIQDTPQRRSFADTPMSSPPPNFSNYSYHDNSNITWSNMLPKSAMQSQARDEAEAQMTKLKMELKQTMDKYSNVCKEALTAKQQALELQRWKIEEERRIEDIQDSDESTRKTMKKEKAKSKATIEAAEANRRLAELEAQKRVSAEMKALKEVEEKNKDVGSIAKSVRYRKYSIEEIEVATEYFTESRKIGEGGYGPVFRCELDHTVVAVKVLRPDAAQGRSQFQQEVEVLSCIRHPNMVLLLGACPEYGCLVYEYMHNGSLEDRLFCRGETKPLTWQHRFRIAAEIATGLLFLHQTKPEPLVHRDLKPANILLDRNLVAKISDVGLARLVPATVANEVTQYRMTSTAGTFCYIDPEYQQTGMLGVKSDVYSLGIMLLQLITAKSPMGLTHYVERAIEKGTFMDILDKSMLDCPVEEALQFAKLSLQCAELRRRDRPDLGTVLLPQLCRLRNIAEDSLDNMMNPGAKYNTNSSNSQVSVGHDTLSNAPSHESWRSSNYSGEN